MFLITWSTLLWDKPCYTYYPFRAIYSDAQNIDADNRINSWLIYRAISYFDFSGGISVDDQQFGVAAPSKFDFKFDPNAPRFDPGAYTSGLGVDTAKYGDGYSFPTAESKNRNEMIERMVQGEYFFIPSIKRFLLFFH